MTKRITTHPGEEDGGTQRRGPTARKRTPTSKERDRFTKVALDCMNDSVKALLRLGATLREAKEKWPHGDYLEWVEQDLKIKPRLSQLIANVDRRFGSHPEIATNFDRSELFYLSAPCRKNLVITLIDDVTAGTAVTPAYKASLLPTNTKKKSNGDRLHEKAACIVEAVSILITLEPDQRVQLIEAWDRVTEKDLRFHFDAAGEPIGELA